MLGPRTSAIVIVAFAAFLSALIGEMRRLSWRAQFGMPIVLGVSIGLVFVTAVQLPGFPAWLATVLVTMLVVASPLATSTFLRTLKREEEQEERGTNGDGKSSQR